MKKIKSSKPLETVNIFCGKIASYLILLLIILISLSVFLRYLFSVGFAWLQDLYIWVHACFLMLGIAYTLNKNAHVRIDIFYRSFSDLKKKNIDIIGSFFFGLPLCYFLIFDGYEYFVRSFLISENSKETGGLPNLFILKFFIFLMGILLLFEFINKFLCRFKK